MGDAKLVAKRDSYDFRRKDIMAELGISRNQLKLLKSDFNKTTKEAVASFLWKSFCDFELEECP